VAAKTIEKAGEVERWQELRTLRAEKRKTPSNFKKFDGINIVKRKT
jgi:hypothetical protein